MNQTDDRNTISNQFRNDYLRLYAICNSIGNFILDKQALNQSPSVRRVPIIPGQRPHAGGGIRAVAGFQVAPPQQE